MRQIIFQDVNVEDLNSMRISVQAKSSYLEINFSIIIGNTREEDQIISAEVVPKSTEVEVLSYIHSCQLFLGQILEKSGNISEQLQILNSLIKYLLHTVHSSTSPMKVNISMEPI